MTRRALLLTLPAALLFLGSCSQTGGEAYRIAKQIPVQYRGRIQSLDSFARQELKQKTGKETWRGLPAYRAVLDALSGAGGASAFAIRPETVRVIPSPGGLAWSAAGTGRDPLDARWQRLLEAYRNETPQAFGNLAAGWILKIRGLSRGASKARIREEILYHDLKPFAQAGIVYALSFLLLAVFGSFRILRFMGCFALVWGVLAHTTGLALRAFILGRPPVANMYESMVFMNWTLILFAVFFAAARRNVTLLSAGAIVSAAVMLYAHLLPLDSSLGVLMPVLNSNYWLTVHVMTIIAAYGALGLAMALAHAHLIKWQRNKLSPWKSHESGRLIQNVLEIGLWLLAIGTVTGGIWANASWGRFWGWDPKETWALVTFLGYLIIVHLRYARRLDDFGLSVGAVAGFLLVLVTWYGVNFLFGKGLHTYGEVSGGVLWVGAFIAAEIVFIAWICLLHSFRQAKNKPRRHRR